MQLLCNTYFDWFLRYVNSTIDGHKQIYDVNTLLPQLVRYNQNLFCFELSVFWTFWEDWH